MEDIIFTNRRAAAQQANGKPYEGTAGSATQQLMDAQTVLDPQSILYRDMRARTAAIGGKELLSIQYSDPGSAHFGLYQ